MSIRRTETITLSEDDLRDILQNYLMQAYPSNSSDPRGFEIEFRLEDRTAMLPNNTRQFIEKTTVNVIAKREM